MKILTCKKTLDTVHDTMFAAKSKLRNSALLRNITDLVPVLYNKTRWSGKYSTLSRFLSIREKLIEVDNNPLGEIPIDPTPMFASKVEKYEQLLKQINTVTTKLQKKDLPLSSCRDILEILWDTIQQRSSKRESIFFRCTLENNYIKPNARIVHSVLFESAVSKLQNGKDHLLTEDERETVECLKKKKNTKDVLQESEIEGDDEDCMETLLKRRKTEKKQSGEYVNASFIVGTVVAVEQLWSVAKYVLSEHRRRMSPQMFEAILFLKSNDRLWDAKLVSDAVHAIRSAKTQNRMMQDNLQLQNRQSVNLE